MSHLEYGPRTEIGTRIFNAQTELALLRMQPEFIYNFDGVETINERELFLHGLIKACQLLETIQERARQSAAIPVNKRPVIIPKSRQPLQPVLSIVS